MCAQNTVCAKCALKTVSDHNIPIRKWPLIRPKSDHCQTIVQPWPRRNPDHCADDCARQMTSDETIRRPKCHWSDHLLNIFRPTPDHRPDDFATMAQTIVRFRWPLIRLSPHPNATDQTIFWTSSDNLQTIVQTTVCVKWALIRPSQKRKDIWKWKESLRARIFTVCSDSVLLSYPVPSPVERRRRGTHPKHTGKSQKVVRLFNCGFFPIVFDLF